MNERPTQQMYKFIEKLLWDNPNIPISLHKIAAACCKKWGASLVATQKILNLIEAADPNIIYDPFNNEYTYQEGLNGKTGDNRRVAGVRQD